MSLCTLNFLILAKPETETSEAVEEHSEIETVVNTSDANKAHFKAEKKVIHMLLTRIRDKIYSTIDVCNIAHEMWIAIERMVKICYTCQAKRRIRQSQYHKLLDILKQYQNEVNELHAEKIARNANPLALVAAAQQYVKDNQTGQFRNQRTVTVVGARENVGSQANQNAEECDDECATLANLIANLTLDIEENKNILKQLKKTNASLSQELNECRSTLKETSRALRESNSTQDSCLISLQNQKVELKKYKTYLNPPIKNDKLELEHKLKETLGLLAQKENDIKEASKLKAYELSVIKKEYDKLVKQSLLTKSCYKGLVKEKNQKIKDLKLKKENDIDKMITMEKP
nr:hypothetical protein [Tanacetum cinerariifolium]